MILDSTKLGFRRFILRAVLNIPIDAFVVTAILFLLNGTVALLKVAPGLPLSIGMVVVAGVLCTAYYNMFRSRIIRTTQRATIQGSLIVLRLLPLPSRGFAINLAALVTLLFVTLWLIDTRVAVWYAVAGAIFGLLVPAYRRAMVFDSVTYGKTFGMLGPLVLILTVGAFHGSATTVGLPFGGAPLVGSGAALVWVISGIALQGVVAFEGTFLSSYLRPERHLRRIHDLRVHWPLTARFALSPYVLLFNLRLISHVPLLRDFLKVRCCLLWESHKFRRLVKTARRGNDLVAAHETSPSRTLEWLAQLGEIRLGDLTAAQVSIHRTLLDRSRDPYSLHNWAYVLWQEGDFSKALGIAEKATEMGDRMPRQLRIATLRLVAQLYCELRLSSSAMGQDNVWRISARRALSEAHGALQEGEIYWPLVYTTGLWYLSIGRYREAASAFYSCTIHRQHSGSYYRLAIFSMIGSTSLSRAEYQLDDLRRRTATGTHFGRLLAVNLERIRRARRRGIVFGPRFLDYQDDTSWDLVNPSPALLDGERDRDAVKGARRFRAEALRLPPRELLRVLVYAPPSLRGRPSLGGSTD